MMPYIITFIVSNIIIYFGERVLKNNKKFGIFILIIGILPLTILAGLRVTDLGWDVKKYCVQIFGAVSNMNSLNAVKNYISIRGTEAGFVYFVYFMSKIFNDINFLLFSMNAIVSFSVLYLAYKNHEKNNMSILVPIFFYETVMYSITYSTLRQCIALSIFFIALVKFFEKKYKSVILLIIISKLFHNSAYVGILVLILILVNDSNKISQRYINFINIICISILVACIITYEPVLKLLWNVGLLNDKYIAYLDTKYNSISLKIRWPYLLFKLFNLLLSILYMKSNSVSYNQKRIDKKWHIMLIYDFIITLFSMKFIGAYRVGYYLYFPALYLYVPKLLQVFAKDKKNQFLAKYMIAFVYILYFLVQLSYYSIYPYRSILR